MLNFLGIDEFGIRYSYNGDEIILPSPKYRICGKLWFSVLFMSWFSSLEELDKFWEYYINAYNDKGDLDESS